MPLDNFDSIEEKKKILQNKKIKKLNTFIDENISTENEYIVSITKSYLFDLEYELDCQKKEYLSLKKQNDSFRNDIKKLNNEIDTKKRIIIDNSEEQNRLNSRLVNCNDEIQKFKNHNNKLVYENKNMDKKINELESELSNLKEFKVNVLNSNSWKITGVFRKIKTFFNS